MKTQKRPPSDLTSLPGDGPQVVEKLTRIISVRLSEAEYQELERFSRAVGAKSIGDLARHSIHKTLYKLTTDSNRATADYLYFLHQSVERLSCEVKGCTQMINEILKSQTQKPRKARTRRRPPAVAAAAPGQSLPTPASKAAAAGFNS